MGIADDLADQAVRLKRGLPCRVAYLAESLGPEDSAAFMAAVEDETRSAAGISRVMREHEWAISNDVITRHRRGDCACGRDPR